VTLPPPAVRPHGARAALLVATVLLGSAAGGFVFYRLAAPARHTLYAVPARDSAAPLVAAHEAPAPSLPERRIPEQLPAISLPDAEGRTRSLTEWQGRPLLVNFWATWCEPCRREIPLLMSLRHERAGDGLEIVGIAVDYRDPVQKYAKSHAIDYPVLIGDKGGLDAVSAFGMEMALPFSVFADRGGQVVTLKVGELHADEAALILDRVHDVDVGRLTLKAAREQIAAGVARLNAARSPPERSGG
jgi:thiol-disulfide isomerase/thioredoxin